MHDHLTLRRILTWYIVSARRTVTVSELVSWVAGVGLELPSRPSKLISDKLRADVARGRIIRVGRGRYTAGAMPDTTWRRIRGVAQQALRDVPAAGGMVVGGDAASGGGGGRAPSRCDTADVGAWRRDAGSVAAGDAPCRCDKSAR
jgi:hypothetical protein